MEQWEILMMVGKAWDSAWRNIDSINAQNANDARQIVATNLRAAKQGWDDCWYQGSDKVRDAAWKAAWSAWDVAWDAAEERDLGTLVAALIAAEAAAEIVAIVELSKAKISAPRAEKGHHGEVWIMP